MSTMVSAVVRSAAGRKMSTVLNSNSGGQVAKSTHNNTEGSTISERALSSLRQSASPPAPSKPNLQPGQIQTSERPSPPKAPTYMQTGYFMAEQRLFGTGF